MLNTLDGVLPKGKSDESIGATLSWTSWFYLGFVAVWSPQETCQCYVDATSPRQQLPIFGAVSPFFLQILLEGRRDSCPAQSSQPTAHGFLCCVFLPDISQTLMK